MNPAFLGFVLWLTVALTVVHGDVEDNALPEAELKIEVLFKPENCDIKSQKGKDKD